MKIFKKILVLLPIVIGLILIISGCGTEVDEPEERFEDNDSASESYNDDENKEEEDMDKGDGNYFLTDVEKDQPMENWIEDIKHEPGEYQYPENERIYLIAAGEQNTGGYSVQITEEEREGDDLTLYYRINAPGPDDIVTQAITYPYLLIEVAEGIEEVNFIKE